VEKLENTLKLLKSSMQEMFIEDKTRADNLIYSGMIFLIDSKI
jgi:hypothetical protein